MRFLKLFLLIAMFCTSIAGCHHDQFLTPDGDTILGPREEGEEREYHLDETGTGHIICKKGGKVTIVIVDDVNKHKPSGEIKPGEVGRTPEFTGPILDFEELWVPEDKLPQDIFEPWPPPELPTGYSEEELRERARRWHRERSVTKRYVIVTEETIDNEVWTIIRTFDGNGQLISIQRKKGKWKKPGLPNEATGEKAILTDDGEAIQWILIDYVTGQVITESRFGLGLLDEVVDIEATGTNIIVITKINNGTWIRVRVFATDGTLISTLDLPGEYKLAITNNANVKAVVSEKNGIIYQDLIIINTGQLIGAIGASGHANNGLKGEHKDLEFVNINGRQRFFEATYDRDRNETTVRITDENGNLISTTIIRGEFKRARVIKDRKVFITSWQKDTEVTVIDPVGGNKTHEGTVRGEFRGRISDNNNGTIGVGTSEGDHTVPLNGP